MKNSTAISVGVLAGEALLATASVHAHREMSHGRVRLHPALREFSRFALLFGSGIDSRKYATVHVEHHDKTGTEQDPHSPAHYGKLPVLLGTAFLNKRARQKIPEILRQKDVFRHRGSVDDPAFQSSPDGSVELRSHPLDFLLDRGGLAYGVGVGTCMLVFGVRKGALVSAVSTATFLGVTGAINSQGHSDELHSGQDVPSNLPRWTNAITFGEFAHGDHHSDPGNPNISGEDDIGYKLIKLLERFGLAEIVPANDE